MLCRAEEEGAQPASLAYESSSEERTQASEPNLPFEPTIYSSFLLYYVFSLVGIVAYSFPNSKYKAEA